MSETDPSPTQRTTAPNLARTVEASLIDGGFPSTTSSTEGFETETDDEGRVMVYWLRGEIERRDAKVAEMGKVLRAAGFKARVAKTYGHPYVSVRTADTTGASSESSPGPRVGEQTDVTGRNRGRTSSAGFRSDAVLAALDSRLDFDVAGESFRDDYPANLLRLAEILSESDGREWPSVLLRRDASNRYDANAIEVHVVGGIGHVGFVPKELARVLAPEIDRGLEVVCVGVEVRMHEDHPDRPGLSVCVRSRESLG